MFTIALLKVISMLIFFIILTFFDGDVVMTSYAHYDCAQCEYLDKICDRPPTRTHPSAMYFVNGVGNFDDLTELCRKIS